MHTHRRYPYATDIQYSVYTSHNGVLSRDKLHWHWTINLHWCFSPKMMTIWGSASCLKLCRITSDWRKSHVQIQKLKLIDSIRCSKLFREPILSKCHTCNASCFIPYSFSCFPYVSFIISAPDDNSIYNNKFFDINILINKPAYNTPNLTAVATSQMIRSNYSYYCYQLKLHSFQRKPGVKHTTNRCCMNADGSCKNAT